jgi:hypothetical protein
MKRHLFIILGLLIVLASCEKRPEDHPIIPQISYQSTAPRTIDVTNEGAFVRIELKFTDGDGDLGLDPNEQEMNIYLKDSRDTASSEYTYPYPFPYIPDYMRPSKGGLEGGITINLGRQYFSVTDSLNIALKADTMQWNIYIVDRAGNKSNLITTDTIYIKL